MTDMHCKRKCGSTSNACLHEELAMLVDQLYFTLSLDSVTGLEPVAPIFVYIPKHDKFSNTLLGRDES